MGWIFAAMVGALMPMVQQCWTGRFRAAAVLACLSVTLLLGLWAWPGTLLVMPIVPLGSAIDAARAWRAGARVTRRYLAAAAGALALTAIATEAFRSYVLVAYRVPSASMMPTLWPDDTIFVDRLTYRLGAPTRGDLIAFRLPTTERIYIGRIVAMAGDEVSTEGIRLVLNGAPLALRDLPPPTYVDEDGRQTEVTAHEEQLGTVRYRVFHREESGWTFPAEPGQCPSINSGYIYETSNVPDVVPPMRPTADGKRCVVPQGTVFVMGDNRWNSNDSRRWGVVPTALIDGEISGIGWPSTLGESRWSRLGRVR